MSELKQRPIANGKAKGPRTAEEKKALADALNLDSDGTCLYDCDSFQSFKLKDDLATISTLLL